jgi:hypothetical protein
VLNEVSKIDIEEYIRILQSSVGEKEDFTKAIIVGIDD